MPVHVYWDDEACSILRLSFVGYWTWEELFEAGETVVSMCAEQLHCVDIISEMLNTSYRPPRFIEQSNALLDNSQQPENLNMVVLTVDDFQYNIFKAYSDREEFHFTYAFAPGIEEARQLIAAARRGEPIQAYIPCNRQLN